MLNERKNDRKHKCFVILCQVANSNWKYKQDAIHNNLTTLNQLFILPHNKKRK